ncbi:hypothetical protein D881_11895 [Corynebacterium ulcerans NCTC 12077]|nr:hypothetical protein D881_11895 [Corynebacterium ulcerans NCTC 12077]
MGDAFHEIEEAATGVVPGVILCRFISKRTYSFSTIRVRQQPASLRNKLVPIPDQHATFPDGVYKPARGAITDRWHPMLSRLNHRQPPTLLAGRHEVYRCAVQKGVLVFLGNLAVEYHPVCNIRRFIP